MQTIDHDHFLQIHFNAPKQGNSFGVNEAEQLNKALQTNKPLVFTNEGRWFCAGGNLTKYRTMDRHEGIKANRIIAEALDKLSSHPHPTIACMTGDCFGGGMELLSAMDDRMASPECYFGFWQRRVGLSLGWGGGQRWLKRVPESALRRHLMNASSFTAYQAYRDGFIDKLAPANQLLSLATKIIESHLSLPQQSYQFVKVTEIQKETDVFEKLWHSPEHLEKLNKGPS